MNTFIDRDDLLTVSEAARRLPGRPHRSTLWRWARKGIQLPDGTRAFLNVHRLGRRVLIAPEDIEAFAEALSSADEQRREEQAERRTGLPQPAPRRSRAEQAEREADELGL